jgi:Brp/Blh family beta-carotene 15,15'-monooxygenase
MNTPIISVNSWAIRWSRIGAIASIALVVLVQLIFGEINLSTQLVLALVALVVGIPHGAIDHLIAIPSEPRSRFLGYIAGYVAIAILAGWAIATWNLIGFQVVVVMSALHFGFGDASFINEDRVAQDKEKNSLSIEMLYALPAGFLPVILPLTDARTLDALERIHPNLENWAGDQVSLFRNLTLLLGLFSFVNLLATKRFSMTFDIFLLTVLALVAPPLIAFAVYFGFWHALRHTARLVPKLPKAEQHIRSGDWHKAIWSVVFPGLYAIAGTLIIAIGLMVISPDNFSSSLLWSTLVIIWALTVPHMATTAKFDLAALKK